MAALISNCKQMEDTNILGIPNVNNSRRMNVTHVQSTRGFTLNINRALRNKINACREVMVQYEYTGGGVTGSMDTATFELFRAACRVYYTNFPFDQGFCEIDDSDDKDCASAVQHTYKIKRDIGTDTQIGYTINLYPTNNRLLINGKDLDRFMDNHLPEVHRIMCTPFRSGRFSSTGQLNQILQTHLQLVLDKRQETVIECDTRVATISKGQANSEQIEHNQSGVIAMSQNKETNLEGILGHKDSNTDQGTLPSLVGCSKSVEKEPVDSKCPVCSRNCATRSAVCEIGNHWIHYV